MDDLEDVIERLKTLAVSAAGYQSRSKEFGDYAEKFIRDGLYLDRLRLFPETDEPSPHGRLVERDGRAWIERPE